MGLRRRHLFRLDPEHDVIYILIEPTQNERGRIRAAFRKMVYGCFSEGSLIGSTGAIR